MFAPVNIKRSI